MHADQEKRTATERARDLSEEGLDAITRGAAAVLPAPARGIVTVAGELVSTVYSTGVEAERQRAAGNTCDPLARAAIKAGTETIIEGAVDLITGPSLTIARMADTMVAAIAPEAHAKQLADAKERLVSSMAERGDDMATLIQKREQREAAIYILAGSFYGEALDVTGDRAAEAVLGERSLAGGGGGEEGMDEPEGEEDYVLEDDVVDEYPVLTLPPTALSRPSLRATPEREDPKYSLAVFGGTSAGLVGLAVKGTLTWTTFGVGVALLAGLEWVLSAQRKIDKKRLKNHKRVVHALDEISNEHQGIETQLKSIITRNEATLPEMQALVQRINGLLRHIHIKRDGIKDKRHEKGGVFHKKHALDKETYKQGKEYCDAVSRRLNELKSVLEAAVKQALETDAAHCSHTAGLAQRC